MKVCYVFQLVYPWDVRVEKIMESIANNSFEGHILSRNNGSLKLVERIRYNLYIHRLSAFSRNWLTNLTNFPAFFSPFWINGIYRLVKDNSIDILIVRDLPLAPAALFVGKITGCPVLMDMAENYPAMIYDTWKYRGPKPIDYLIRNPVALKYLEKMVVSRMEGILVVSAYSKERLVSLGVDPYRIWIVSNTPRLDSFDQDRGLNSPIAKKIRGSSSFIITYVGGLEESRGLDIVLKALPEIHKSIPDAIFVIVGSGTSEANLRKLAMDLRILESVKFIGWVESQQVPAIIKASDVCIVPHYVTEHTDTTIPNKIFDYMAQKKPVIVTSSRALSSIVLSSECGNVYMHNDYMDLAKKVIELKSPQLRERYGSHGYDAVKSRFNWALDEKNLLSALRELSTSKR